LEAPVVELTITAVKVFQLQSRLKSALVKEGMHFTEINLLKFADARRPRNGFPRYDHFHLKTELENQPIRSLKIIILDLSRKMWM